MKEKDLLEQLKQMRDSMQEAIKWLDMPPSYGKIWRLWRLQFRWSRSVGNRVPKYVSWSGAFGQGIRRRMFLSEKEGA